MTLLQRATVEENRCGALSVDAIHFLKPLEAICIESGPPWLDTELLDPKAADSQFESGYLWRMRAGGGALVCLALFGFGGVVGAAAISSASAVSCGGGRGPHVFGPEDS